MSNGRLFPGATFQYPGTHNDPEKLHLTVVLTDPAIAKGRVVLIVPIVTRRRRCDLTCILRDHDHPFIRHESCVDYRRMELRPEALPIKMLDSGAAVPEPPMPAAVLERILRGVRASPYSAPFAVAFAANPS